MSSAWGLIGIEPVRFRLLASCPEEGAHLHDSWWAVSQQGRAALRSPLLCAFPRICRSCPHSLGRILTLLPAMPDSGGPGGIQLPCLVPQPRDSQIRIQDRWQGSSEPSLLSLWSPDRQHQPDLLKCTSSGHALVRLNQKLSNRGLTGHPHRSDAGSSRKRIPSWINPRDPFHVHPPCFPTAAVVMWWEQFHSSFSSWNCAPQLL